METTPYDRRMTVLEKIQYGAANRGIEIDAAAATYERLKTAIAIAETLLPGAPPSAVATLAAEIGASARHAQRLRSRE